MENSNQEFGTYQLVYLWSTLYLEDLPGYISER